MAQLVQTAMLHANTSLKLKLVYPEDCDWKHISTKRKYNKRTIAINRLVHILTGLSSMWVIVLPLYDIVGN